MSTDCAKGVGACFDSHVAQHLKTVAIVIILTSSVMGVCMPLIGPYIKAFRPESNLFFVMKSFAAGVILATGYVHMLPDAFGALSNPCLADHPWAVYPFAGFIAMVASLFVLLVDFSATSYFENQQRKTIARKGSAASAGAQGKDVHKASLTQVSVHDPKLELSHSADTFDDNTPTLAAAPMHGHAHGPHSLAATSAENSQLRHRVISQVLELGIVAHSVIIGITLGTSDSPCTIRPLIAALTFHQFFEGMALGSCIAQAGFKKMSSAVMAFFFSVTTPLGIGIGMGIASSYNENSPKALIVQGLLDSMSAGILLYMALVDLIATDFLSGRLKSNVRLQIYTYIALFLGSGAMAAIAYWA